MSDLRAIKIVQKCFGFVARADVGRRFYSGSDLRRALDERLFESAETASIAASDLALRAKRMHACMLECASNFAESLSFTSPARLDRFY